MKGDVKIINISINLLGNELVAPISIFSMPDAKNFKLMRLNDAEYYESIDEMKHADKYIERILFFRRNLNGRIENLGIGEDVE